MEENESYRKAKAKVQRLKGFYHHLAAYVIVNLLLFVINIVTSPDTLWFWYVTVIWGIFVVWNAYGVFKEPNDEWEEKKIQEIMEKEKK